MYAICSSYKGCFLYSSSHMCVFILYCCSWKCKMLIWCIYAASYRLEKDTDIRCEHVNVMLLCNTFSHVFSALNHVLSSQGNKLQTLACNLLTWLYLTTHCTDELEPSTWKKTQVFSVFVSNYTLFWWLLSLQVSSSNATTISHPILQLSGDGQAQVAQVAQGQDLNAATGQTLQSVQLVNPGTFLIQAQTVTATGQIQWQTFQVIYGELAGCFLMFQCSKVASQVSYRH